MPIEGRTYVDQGINPYTKDGKLMLGTFPGMTSNRHVVTGVLQVPTLLPNMDGVNEKPDQLTHFAIYTAGIATGYETRGTMSRAENKAAWFTPEVLRAARVFLKDLSTAQYTNTGASKVDKLGFTYYPSELSGYIDEGRKGRWVHLVSQGFK